MKKRTYKIYAGDFETTVYNGQVRTDVWAAALCELGTEDVTIDGSIEAMFDRLTSMKKHCIIYFHNLKFDGSFILDHLIVDLGVKQATKKTGDGDRQLDWLENKDMPYNSVKYLISNMGAWYDIVYRTKTGHFLEFRDSLKLFPFTLAQVADAFKTKHHKLEMEYKGLRYPGCPISDAEREYIAADVLVLKEALEFMFSQGHNLLTIGANCLHEYKELMGKYQYKFFFPSLEDIKLDPKLYGAANADAYIRKSYRGGWCYLVKGKERRVFYDGCTVDVNSLYPSVMSSESRCKYPVREPKFWRGDFIPDEARKPNKYYFVRVRTQFKIKDGYLPTIQVKNNLNYKATEYLTTSDIYNPDDGKYYSVYYDNHGILQPAVIEMTLTCTDWELIQEHYNLYNTVILDGCYFDAQMGIFDEYIDKYAKIKQESKGAMRTLAKLFLNNLYGKMATSTNAAFKVAYARDDDRIGFYTVTEAQKPAGYIAVGSAITSYARNFTIRAAQKNYYGEDQPGFIYADTDSLHLDLPPETGEYCSNEIEKFYSIHKSIARGRGEQVRRVPVYMISNPVTILNPYYAALGISDRLNKDTKFLRGRGWVMEQGYNDSAKQAEEESGFYKALGGTKYGAYGAQGVYLSDSDTFIAAPSGRGQYLATIRYNGVDYAVRAFPTLGIVYCDKSVDGSFPHKLAVTTEDHQINYVMLAQYRSFVEQMRYFFERGSFRFADQASKQAILQSLSYR